MNREAKRMTNDTSDQRAREVRGARANDELATNTSRKHGRKEPQPKSGAVLG